MALSEAADAYAAGAHEWGLNEAPAPAVVPAVQKVAPPRPPAARPPPRPAPPKQAATPPSVDPWTDNGPSTLSPFQPAQVVPVNQEVLVHTAATNAAAAWDPWASEVQLNWLLRNRTYTYTSGRRF